VDHDRSEVPAPEDGAALAELLRQARTEALHADDHTLDQARLALRAQMLEPEAKPELELEPEPDAEPETEAQAPHTTSPPAVLLPPPPRPPAPPPSTPVALPPPPLPPDPPTSATAPAAPPTAPPPTTPPPRQPQGPAEQPLVPKPARPQQEPAVAVAAPAPVSPPRPPADAPAAAEVAVEEPRDAALEPAAGLDHLVDVLRLLADRDAHLARLPDAAELRDLLVHAADQLDGKVQEPSPPAGWMIDLLSRSGAYLDEHARRRVAHVLVEAQDEAVERRAQARQGVREVFGALQVVDAAEAELEASLALLATGRATSEPPTVHDGADDDT
jgi:hypothetical protein